MNWKTGRTTALFGLLLCVSLGAIPPTAIASKTYSEEREPCAQRDPLRRPYFGDLHVHTRYSLDASTQGTRTTPAQAYRFAQGERIGIQPWTEEGEPLRSLQLDRPLDFAMVSDHAELIGEVHMCNTPGVAGHDSWQCRFYRWWPRGAYYLFNFMASVRQSHLGLCGENDALCLEAARIPWREMQEAAERHYDRSGDCRFTTFMGYEWTGLDADSGGNLHRNVVFRNGQVPGLPPSFIEYPGAGNLWQALDSQCNGSDTGCDSLVIPHNSNLSAGNMFGAVDDAGAAMSADYAATRARFEPLVEIMQHKGASECFFQAGITDYDPSTQEVRTFGLALTGQPLRAFRLGLGFTKTIADHELTTFGGTNRDSTFTTSALAGKTR